MRYAKQTQLTKVKLSLTGNTPSFSRFPLAEKPCLAFTFGVVAICSEALMFNRRVQMFVVFCIVMFT